MTKMSMKKISEKLEGELEMEFFKKEDRLLYQQPFGWAEELFLDNMMTVTVYRKNSWEWEEKGYSQISLQEFLNILAKHGGDPDLWLENLGISNWEVEKYIFKTSEEELDKLLSLVGDGAFRGGNDSRDYDHVDYDHVYKEAEKLIKQIKMRT